MAAARPGAGAGAVWLVVATAVVLLVAAPHMVSAADKVPVKVIQGAPRGASASVVQQPRPPIPSRSSSPISGPALLHAVEDSCYQVSDTSYEYQVCPFHNVTQRELASSWSSFYGLLGIWGDWVVEDGVYTAMHFTDGTPCHDALTRSITVALECGPAHLDVVQEPETCVYATTLKLPEVCSADMQVSPEQAAEMAAAAEAGAAEAAGLGLAAEDGGGSSGSGDGDSAGAEGEAADGRGGEAAAGSGAEAGRRECDCRCDCGALQAGAAAAAAGLECAPAAVVACPDATAALEALRAQAAALEETASAFASNFIVGTRSLGDSSAEFARTFRESLDAFQQGLAGVERVLEGGQAAADVAQLAVAADGSQSAGESRSSASSEATAPHDSASATSGVDQGGEASQR